MQHVMGAGMMTPRPPAVLTGCISLSLNMQSPQDQQPASKRCVLAAYLEEWREREDRCARWLAPLQLNYYRLMLEQDTGKSQPV